MKKRILSMILSVSMAIAPVVGGASSVYATEAQVTTSTVQQLVMPQESNYSADRTPNNWVTKVAKTAIKFIIKNKSAAAKVVERVSGKAVAANFLKHFDKITEGLQPLLEWSDIPAQAVYDFVFRALWNAGVSRSVAANVALAIKEGLSWFI